MVDEGSRKLIDNAVKEDDILNENVTSKRFGLYVLTLSDLALRGRRC